MRWRLEDYPDTLWLRSFLPEADVFGEAIEMREVAMRVGHRHDYAESRKMQTGIASKIQCHSMFFNVIQCHRLSAYKG